MTKDQTILLGIVLGFIAVSSPFLWPIYLFLALGTVLFLAIAGAVWTVMSVLIDGIFPWRKD